MTGQGRVWIGTEEKLFAYLIKEKKFILFGEPDGVVQNEYLEKPRLLSSSGDVYMGGVNGLLHINRHLPDDPALLPTLQLADILVGGERVYDRISNDHQLSVNEKSKPIIIKIITRDKDISANPCIDTPYRTERTKHLFLFTGNKLKQSANRQLSHKSRL